MPTILLDHSRYQLRRWLLRNSPAIPIAIGVAFLLYFVENTTVRAITIVFACLCVFVLFLGAIFRRYLLYREDGQLVLEYRFLGLFTAERQVAALDDCLLVRYHAWQIPFGNDKTAWYGAIYLHFKQAKPWRICDQAHYSMDVDADEPMAEQLAAALGVTVEKVQEPPAI